MKWPGWAHAPGEVNDVRIRILTDDGKLDRIDLVMWTRNAGDSFARVLNMINAAVPESRVCHRMIVDANSTDATTSIATTYGWNVVKAERVGIPYQANQALKMVDTEFFASFEHDILLNPKWLERMESLIEDNPRAICVQGLRVAKGSKSLEAIEKYSRLRGRVVPIFFTMDNNLFRTSIVKSLGGFPIDCPLSADALLREKALAKRYQWITDLSVTSGHFRPSMTAELRRIIHHSIYARYFWSQPLKRRDSAAFRYATLVISPLTGARLAGRCGVPLAAPAYVLLRYVREWMLLLYGNKKIRVTTTPISPVS